MFTKISIFAVLAVWLSLLVAHGAEKNWKFNADKVIKDLSRKFSKSSSLSQKKLNEISLQTWNEFDPAFTSGWWLSSELYSDSSCSKSLGLAQDDLETVCNVVTVEASNGETYYSNQWRYDTQDLSRSTMVFFKNSNCEGTPVIQANTVPSYFPPLNECLETDQENDFISYVKITVQRYAVGNPFDTYAVKTVILEQTDTCDSEGLVANFYSRSGTCMNLTSTEDVSSKFIVFEGGSLNNIGIEIYPCANCACRLQQESVVAEDSCVVDNPYADDDDDMNSNSTNNPDDRGVDDQYYDDDLFDDAQLVSYAGYVDEESHYFTYALPQTCLWATGCSNSPGGKTCEVGTYCKEYKWWSQCLENTVNNSKPLIANPKKKCISTRNGHGPNAHWGCNYNADCCNPQAVCNAFTRTCNLPCEAMDEPESLSISNDAALSGSSSAVLVLVMVGVGLFAILASLSLYYFICRRGGSDKGWDFENQSEMAVIIVDSETEVHTFE